MHVTRRPLSLFLAAAVVAVVTGAVLGATTHSDAAPAPASAATTAGNPRVPDTLVHGRDALRPGERMIAGDPTTSWLGPAQLTSGPQHASTITTGYSLQLQDDGNLVEYRDTATGHVAVWSTATRTGVTVQFQTDGNVVLRDRAGKALWATGTAGRPTAYFDVYGNGQVVTQDSTGHVISASGPSLVALPGTFVASAVSPAFYDIGSPYRDLQVQTDGNLVEYLHDSAGKVRPVWSSHTAGAGEVRLAAQSDGNLVLRQASTGRAVWASGAKGGSAFYQLDVQDDGNLVLYRTDGIRRVQAVWATGIRR